MKILYGLLLLIPLSLSAQTKAIVDSLTAVANNPRLKVITRVDAANKLAHQYARTDSAHTYQYAQQATALATPIKYKTGMADALSNMLLYQTIKSHTKAAFELLQRSNALYEEAKSPEGIGVNYTYITEMYTALNKFDDALSYCTKAQEIFQKNKSTKHYADVLIAFGVIYKNKGQKEKALDYYLKAAGYANQTGSQTAQGRLYNDIGNLMREEKNYNGALDYYDKALAIFKNANDQINMGVSVLAKSLIYAERSQYGDSEKMLYQAIDAFTKGKLPRGLIFCYNNLGGIAIRQKHYKDAIQPLDKGIELSNQNKIYALIAQLEQNKAYALTYLGEYVTAEKLFEKALADARANHNLPDIIGDIHSHWATLDSARGNFKQAFERRSISQNIKDSLLNLNLSKQINELQTKYETEKKERQIGTLTQQSTLQQLQLSQSKLKLSDQNLQLNKNKLQLSEQDLELSKRQTVIAKKNLESQQKQQEIGKLNQQNTIQQLAISKRNLTIGIVCVVLIAVLLFGLLFYNRYKRKQEARLQQEVIHQQDLAAKGIIEAEERERKRIAADLHDGLGQLFSAVRLNMSSLMERVKPEKAEDAALSEKTLALVDESCREIRTMAHQMMPNTLLKSGLASAIRDFIDKIDAEKLKVTLEAHGLSNRLDNDTEVILYRVIQECVNNVIKHAQATKLDIQLSRDKEELTVTIEDNGRGFDTREAVNQDGIGLKNMASRLAFLKGSVDFSSSPGKGTLVAIYVPLN